MNYGLALGSNMGDRLANLRRARDLLLAQAPDPRTLLCSAVYQTAPVDCAPEATPFYNACLEIDLPRPPRNVFALAREIEVALGRAAVRRKNAPRPIDIDILYAGDETVAEPDLEIPHPRLAQRRFVLEPLHDIRPGLVLPGESRSIAALLNDLESAEPPLILVTRDW